MTMHHLLALLFILYALTSTLAAHPTLTSPLPISKPFLTREKDQHRVPNPPLSITSFTDIICHDNPTTNSFAYEEVVKTKIQSFQLSRDLSSFEQLDICTSPLGGGLPGSTAADMCGLYVGSPIGPGNGFQIVGKLNGTEVPAVKNICYSIEEKNGPGGCFNLWHR